MSLPFSIVRIFLSSSKAIHFRHTDIQKNHVTFLIFPNKTIPVFPSQQGLPYIRHNTFRAAERFSLSSSTTNIVFHLAITSYVFIHHPSLQITLKGTRSAVNGNRRRCLLINNVLDCIFSLTSFVISFNSSFVSPA